VESCGAPDENVHRPHNIRNHLFVKPFVLSPCSPADVEALEKSFIENPTQVNGLEGVIGGHASAAMLNRNGGAEKRRLNELAIFRPFLVVGSFKPEQKSLDKTVSKC
jgi:hypothetical protein